MVSGKWQLHRYLFLLSNTISLIPSAGVNQVSDIAAPCWFVRLHSLDNIHHFILNSRSILFLFLLANYMSRINSSQFHSSGLCIFLKPIRASPARQKNKVKLHSQCPRFSLANWAGTIFTHLTQTNGKNMLLHIFLPEPAKSI